MGMGNSSCGKKPKIPDPVVAEAALNADLARVSSNDSDVSQVDMAAQIQQMPTQMLQQTQQMPGSPLSFYDRRWVEPGGVSLVTHPDSNVSPEAPLAAVILTICDGGSYDEMFTSVPQEGPEGTRVAVYQASSNSLPDILKSMKGETLNGESGLSISKMVEEINAVENDCVVFNWECCGGCSNSGFPPATKDTALDLMALMITRGSMVMCSDFSLKALIADWKPDLLGPNPFVNIGGFDHHFKLHFDPAQLADCPSSQLQKVGELCADKAEAEVHAMSDTIVYVVDPSKTQHPAYELSVLTVASSFGGGFNLQNCPEAAGMLCRVGDHEGAAGHVLLTYPTGGTLLTSCGHWLELVKLDVSAASLLKVAQKGFGGQYADDMVADIASAQNATERSSKMQFYAREMVQKSAPCKYSTQY